MTLTRPVTYRNLTPDEVLAEIRLFCINSGGARPEELDRALRFENALTDLGSAVDSEADFGDLITVHGLTLPNEVTFRNTETIGELCEIIARLSQVPVIEPLTILGKSCESAGAFVTLKQMLAEAGEDVSELAPSSQLRPYFCAQPQVFQRFRLAFARRRLAEHRRPLGIIKHTVPAALILFYISAAFLSFSPVITCCGLLLSTLLLVWLWIDSRVLKDTNGLKLTTFRDLIYTALGTPRPVADL